MAVPRTGAGGAVQSAEHAIPNEFSCDVRRQPLLALASTHKSVTYFSRKGAAASGRDLSRPEEPPDEDPGLGPIAFGRT